MAAAPKAAPKVAAKAATEPAEPDTPEKKYIDGLLKPTYEPLDPRTPRRHIEWDIGSRDIPLPIPAVMKGEWVDAFGYKYYDHDAPSSLTTLPLNPNIYRLFSFGVVLAHETITADKKSKSIEPWDDTASHILELTVISSSGDSWIGFIQHDAGLESRLDEDSKLIRQICLNRARVENIRTFPTIIDAWMACSAWISAHLANEHITSACIPVFVAYNGYRQLFPLLFNNIINEKHAVIKSSIVYFYDMVHVTSPHMLKTSDTPYRPLRNHCFSALFAYHYNCDFDTTPSSFKIAYQQLRVLFKGTVGSATVATASASGIDVPISVDVFDELNDYSPIEHKLCQDIQKNFTRSYMVPIGLKINHMHGYKNAFFLDLNDGRSLPTSLGAIKVLVNYTASRKLYAIETLFIISYFHLCLNRITTTNRDQNETKTEILAKIEGVYKTLHNLKSP